MANTKKIIKKTTKAINKKATKKRSKGSSKSHNKKASIQKELKKKEVFNKKGPSKKRYIKLKQKVSAIKITLLLKINKFTKGSGKNFTNLIFAQKGLAIAIISLILLISVIFLPWYKANINFNIFNVDSNNISIKLSGTGIYIHIDENLMEPITEEILDKLDGIREIILIILNEEIDNILDNLRTDSSLTNPKSEIDSNIDENLDANIKDILNIDDISSDTSKNSVVDLKSIVDTEVEKLNTEINKLQIENITIDDGVINALIQKLINSKKEEILELIDSNLLNFITTVSNKLEVINNDEINKEISTKYNVLKWISLVMFIINAIVILLICAAKFLEYKRMLKTNIFVNVLVIIMAQIYLIFIVILILAFIGLVSMLGSIEEFFVDISLVELNLTLGAGIILVGLSAIMTFLSSIINPIENYRKIKYTKHNETKD